MTDPDLAIALDYAESHLDGRDDTAAALVRRLVGAVRRAVAERDALIASCVRPLERGGLFTANLDMSETTWRSRESAEAAIRTILTRVMDAGEPIDWRTGHDLIHAHWAAEREDLRR